MDPDPTSKLVLSAYDIDHIHHKTLLNNVKKIKAFARKMIVAEFTRSYFVEVFYC